MPIAVTVGFVDRRPELALFHRMLAGETAKRILLTLERGEQGKTYFLLRLFHECEQQAVPVVLLDFDQRRSGLTDYLSVAREVRRYLGDECTPAICACEGTIARGRPLVSIHTGEGDAGVDFGKKGVFREAQIEEIAGRDYVSTRIGSISEAAPTADQIARQRADMGRALCRDLAGLAASHRRVVLLLDTFEDASEDTCHWLESWLLEPLRRILPHVALVVAGRPVCRAFFDQPRLWSGLVATIDCFSPFSDDDILAHYRQRGLPVAEAEKPLLLDLARLSPAMMAQIGDGLEQVRGGVQ